MLFNHSLRPQRAATTCQNSADTQNDRAKISAEKVKENVWHARPPQNARAAQTERFVMHAVGSLSTRRATSWRRSPVRLIPLFLAAVLFLRRAVSVDSPKRLLGRFLEHLLFVARTQGPTRCLLAVSSAPAGRCGFFPSTYLHPLLAFTHSLTHAWRKDLFVRCVASIKIQLFHMNMWIFKKVTTCNGTGDGHRNDNSHSNISFKRAKKCPRGKSVTLEAKMELPGGYDQIACNVALEVHLPASPTGLSPRSAT